jgi:short subunit dehydrogenase-like uncharacterized protein
MIQDEDEAQKTPFEKKYFSRENMNKYKPLADALRKQEALTKTKNEKDKEEAKKEVDKHMADFCQTEWCSNWDYKKYDVIFYGVSGYTGYLMMEYLKREPLRTGKTKFTFAFGGRTKSKVEAMRDKEFAGTPWADTPCISAQYDDLVSVIDMVKACHVIVNVAGPYMLTEGELLVDACIYLKTDYIDISGEVPHSLKVYKLHQQAKEAGVMVVASAAAAGGFPDMGMYLCAKKLRADYGEEVRYGVTYICAGGSAQAPSGGTLKTRAAMNQADDDVKSAMTDPFSMGGFVPDLDRNGVKMINIQKGTGFVTPKVRQEDMDANLSRVAQDPKLGCWRAPFVYAFFETRVVRRSNMLMAELGGQPYGHQLNYMEYTFMPDEATARQAVKSSGATSVDAEKEKLKKAGKYYGQGEGPALEDIEDAWMMYRFYAETPSGKGYKMSIRGKDGYYETARMAIELALTLRFDRLQLPFKGGALTPAVAGGECLAKRILETGVTFKMGEWEGTDDLPALQGFSG